jgi:hypothetical protein
VIWHSYFPAAWLALTALLFQLFDYWQGRPLRKTVLFVVIGALCWVFFRWTAQTRRGISVSPLLTAIAAGGAVLVLGNSFVRGINTFAESRKAGDVFHDQGQIADRALGLAAKRVNPYGSQTLLDPLAFSDQVRRLARRPDCGFVNPDAAQRAFADYWYGGVDPDRMFSLRPDISTLPACDDLRVKFHSLGYHYGPVLLLAYLPLVALLGPAGIYATHLLALIVWLVLLSAWLRSTLLRTAWLPAAAAIILFLLAPAHVNKIFLELSASDLVATILESAGLMLWLVNRDVPAAVLFAASLGTKLFPGLLFAPLLLRNVRSVLTFVAVAAALYLPFALWDASGLYHNLLYPFTIRDSTSPLAAMPETAGTLLRLVAAAGFAAWIWRLALLGWPQRLSLLFLVIVHLAALILGGMSHNNYLIWAMSVIAIFWIRLTDRTDAPAS